MAAVERPGAPPTDPAALAALAAMAPTMPSAAGTADDRVVAAPQPTATFAMAPPPAAPVAPPKPVCADGELCGDHTLAGWRDPADGVDLLASDESDSFLVSAQLAVAELFATGDDESIREDLGGLESLDTLLVRIQTDVSGVPVQIDGKNVGYAPMVGQVAAGPHQIRLGDGAISEFTLQATSDPTEWCFEAHGRQFKYVVCR